MSGPGPAKRPDDRRIGRDARTKAITSTAEAEYQSSFRAGAALAAAALAQAAHRTAPGERQPAYLRAAEHGRAFLAAQHPPLPHQRRHRHQRRLAVS